MKPLTLTEFTKLHNGGFTRKSIAAVLQARGISDNIPASEVLSVIYGSKLSDIESQLDLLASVHGDMLQEAFLRKQEKLTMWYWLPMALATICMFLSARTGKAIPMRTFLTAWGLPRLAAVTKKATEQVEDAERDEAFLSFLGV